MIHILPCTAPYDWFEFFVGSEYTANHSLVQCPLSLGTATSSLAVSSHL